MVHKVHTLNVLMLKASWHVDPEWLGIRLQSNAAACRGQLGAGRLVPQTESSGLSQPFFRHCGYPQRLCNLAVCAASQVTVSHQCLTTSTVDGEVAVKSEECCSSACTYEYLPSCCLQAVAATSSRMRVCC